jgi:hypothetical protein
VGNQANPFVSAGDALRRLHEEGLAHVSPLARDTRGNWVAEARHGDRSLEVAVDQNGHVIVVPADRGPCGCPVS